MKNLKTFENFDDDWDDDELEVDAFGEYDDDVENSEGFTLDNLYDRGADAIREGANLLADRGSSEWDELVNSDPIDMITKLKELGTEQALSLVGDIEEVEERIASFPN